MFLVQINFLLPCVVVLLLSNYFLRMPMIIFVFNVIMGHVHDFVLIRIHL
jgi:hypothetical protein